MDIKLLGPFIDATINVPDTIAYTEAQPGEPFLKEDNSNNGEFTIGICLEE